LDQLRKKISGMTEIPKNGFVHFNGFYTDEERVEHHYAHTLEPFRPVKQSVWLADYHFHPDVLRRLLEEAAGQAYGLVLFDFTGLILTRIKGSHNDVVQRVAMQIPRFRVTNQDTGTLMSRVIEFLYANYTDEKSKKLNVEGLVLAGNNKLHERLAEVLPKDLHERVVAVLNVRSEEEDGMHEALEQLTDKLPQVRLVQEIVLLQEFFRLQKEQPNKVAAGAAQVEAVVDAKKARVLLLYEDLKIHRVTDRTRVAYYEEGLNRNDVEQLAQPRHDELLSHYFLTLANKYDVDGTKVELVSSHSRLGQRFWKDIGVAVMLK